MYNSYDVHQVMKISFVMLNFALYLVQAALGTTKKNRLASGTLVYTLSLTFSCKLGYES